MGQAWHPEAWMAYGLSEAEALRLAPLAAEILGLPDPDIAWQRMTAEVLRPELPFALHQALYRELAERWPETKKGPLPVWYPSLEDRANANISELMAHLDLASYSQLHRWTTDNRFSFWQYTIDRLGIRFKNKPSTLAKTSGNPGQPVWLPDATLNIVESCFLAPPDQPAIVWQAHPSSPLVTYTIADLEHWSAQVAQGLRTQGFHKGDAIAVDMVMNPASIAIYLGIVRAGCAVISIADSFSPKEIATRLRIGKAKGIFTMDVIRRAGKLLPMYEKIIAAEAPRAIVLACDENLMVTLREGDLDWREFLGKSGTFETEICRAGDTINILFSSGTTGDPKAIAWDHTTPLKCAADGFYHHDVHPGDVVAWPTNLGWMMGPWLIFATLLNRGTIALYGDAPTGLDFCKFVQDAKVNLLGVVPSLVKSWRQNNAIAGLDWSAIHAFSSTGECSNAQDMHYLMAMAGYRPVIEYCGGTEIGGGYLVGTIIQPAVPAAFTTAALGLDLVILDEAESPAEVGELFLVPPSIGLSSNLLNRDHETVYYADVPQLSDGRVLRRHGDQVLKLPGGYYRAEGRADDTMNLGGIKVGSAEIERVLKTVDGVDETAAVAIAPSGGGPGQLVVFAVLAKTADSQTVRVQMQRAIRQQLNPLFKLEDVCVVEALPRTASGKVMRRVLRAEYTSS